MSGTLYVVATPLGNLDDIAPRAAQILRMVSLVACEDTRRTSRLLERLELSTPTVSCHKFNERRRIDELLARLGRGESLALVSDGGTPAVSDPGALLVDAALDAGLTVSPVPGPSAVAAALSVSGMSADRFVFEGFLPHRSGERRRRLRALRDEPRTIVCFEAPHRIRDCLADLSEVLGSRSIMLGRELTKLHETVLRAPAAELLERLDTEVRGEITLVIAGSQGEDDDTDGRADRVREVWRRELDASGGERRPALRRAARTLGLGRAALQRLLDELGIEGPDR